MAIANPTFWGHGRRAVVPGAVFFLAFTLRVAFIWDSQDIAALSDPTPGMDISLHWEAARAINRGASTDKPYFELMVLKFSRNTENPSFRNLEKNLEIQVHPTKLQKRYCN